MTVKELYEECLERGFEDAQLMLASYSGGRYVEEPVVEWDAPTEDVVLLMPEDMS